MNSTDDLFKQGIKLFRNGSFEDAVKLFLKVAHKYQCEYKSNKSSGSVSKARYNRNYINVLDCLAACYMKINEMEKALKYSRVMTKIDPFGCKGYLRLSKVYFSLGNDDDAIATLNRGLLKIQEAMKVKGLKVNDLLYQQLKNEVKKYCSPDDIKPLPVKENEELHSTEILKNPLDLLPLELIDKIFSHFSPSFRLQCLLVSRSWYEKLILLSTVSDNFILRNNIRKQQFDKFISFVNKTHNPHREITLSSLYLQPHESAEKSIIKSLFEKKITVSKLMLRLVHTNFAGLMSHFKIKKNFSYKLKSLNICLSMFIIPELNLEKSMKMFPNLEQLSIFVTSFDKRNRDIRWYEENDTLNDLTNQIFDKLTLINISVDPGAHKSSINSQLFNSFFSKNSFPHIKHLSLSYVSVTPEVFANLINPNMVSLDLNCVSQLNISHIILGLIKSPSRNLKRLKLIECDTNIVLQATNFSTTFKELGIFAKLEILVLKNSCITFQALCDILMATICRLKLLHIESCPNLLFSPNNMQIQTGSIGDKDILQLVSKIPDVQSLSLIACQGFNSEIYNKLTNYICTNNIFQKLRHLNLSMNRIDDKSLKYFFHKNKKIKLFRLVIQYCLISPETVKYIYDHQYCESIDYKMDERVVLPA